MPSFPYETVDVFTDRPFGGNPLAVFTDARGLSDAQMQALAAEMNYSETTFVLPADDPANDARVRIFHRTAEMPFAGHPNVGTACVLAGRGCDRDGILLFEEMAGLVEVRVARDAAGLVTGATIAAPQALSLGLQLPADAIAACAGLQAQDVLTGRHPPQQASVGVKFVLVEVTPEALTRAMPVANPRSPSHLTDVPEKVKVARSPDVVEYVAFCPLHRGEIPAGAHEPA